jgi:hypothetical protein
VSDAQALDVALSDGGIAEFESWFSSAGAGQ